MSPRFALVALAAVLFAQSAFAQEMPAEPTAEGGIASDPDFAALGLDLEESEVDLDFHFSGFADFTSMHPINLSGVTTLQLPYTHTFLVGNVNLYLSKNLSADFRTMAEVRFSYLPNGTLTFDGNTVGLVSTQVNDYTEADRLSRWGSIIIQRLYLEWSMHPLIAVRVGQFLTPYGIWNVDHGSPVYITVQRPYTVTNNLFPESQTGLEALGRWDLGDHSTLGYHFTFSNGAGPISEYRDLDSNKAIGGRLYWLHHGAGEFRLGASALYGRETVSSPALRITAVGLDVSNRISAQFDALALAADLSYRFHGFYVQAEWASQQRRYTDEGRAARGQYFAPVSRAFPSNSLSWSGYVLLAYTLPWFALTPYVLAEYAHEILFPPVPDYILRTLAFHGGLKIHPIDAVTFKAEFAHASFIDGGTVFDRPVNLVLFQAAWAF
jgi:hypothetical protein